MFALLQLILAKNAKKNTSNYQTLNALKPALKNNTPSQELNPAILAMFYAKAALTPTDVLSVLTDTT
jgi:hypothetical protein